MKGSLTIFLVLVLHAVSTAQLHYKSIVLHNGYENGLLVRNHVEIHYTHYTSQVISGYIQVSRVLEYAHTNNIAVYNNSIQKDTIASFYGTIIKGKKQGTFVSAPDGNTITIHTYKNNSIEGIFEGFYTFGQLYNKGYIHDGQQTSDYVEYYANGNLAKRISRNTIKDLALEEHFYTNGQAESQGSIYHDKKVNEWVYYDYYGNLKKKEYYNNRGKLLKTTR